MAKAYIFYNPFAGNGHCREQVEKLRKFIQDETFLCDMTKPETYERYLFQLEKQDYIILCGGDGTINKFVNLTEDIELKNDIYYYPTGRGNDFARDLGKHSGDNPFQITGYIHDLPFVDVKNRKYRFINGIGYGLDGYCYEEGKEINKDSDQPINYSAIALKGVFRKYKPTSATVTVDGVPHHYNKVWLAPTMNGRFYGGGAMPTPNQIRTNPNKSISVMILHGSGRLKSMMLLSSILKGKHIKHRKYVDIFTGHEISVEFDKPTALQIDGEIILDVTSYRAVSSQLPQNEQCSEMIG